MVPPALSPAPPGSQFPDLGSGGGEGCARRAGVNGSRGLRVCSGPARLARGTSSSTLSPLRRKCPARNRPRPALRGRGPSPSPASWVRSRDLWREQTYFPVSRLENKERWVVGGYRNIFRFKRGRFSALRWAHPLPNSRHLFECWFGALSRVLGFQR